MPTSVYRLVFQDPNLEKFIPNKLQIGTYTNDTVKIVGTCQLYLVHVDTKKLIESMWQPTMAVYSYLANPHLH